MKRIKCIVRESKVGETTDALKGLNVSDVTVTARPDCQQ
jgi:nitrogen regulatory protein PII